MQKKFIITGMLLFLVSYFINCQSIWDSIKNGDLEKVKNFVEKNGFDLNTKDTEGHTPLEYAFAYNNYELVKYILSKNVTIEVFPSFNFLVVYFKSIHEKKPEIIKLLVDSGANLKTLNLKAGYESLKNLVCFYLAIFNNEQIIEDKSYYIYLNCVGLFNDKILLDTGKRYKLEDDFLKFYNYEKDSYKIKDLLLDVYMQNYEKLTKYIKEGNDPSELVNFSLLFDDINTYNFFKERGLINDSQTMHQLDTNNILAVNISSYLKNKGNIDNLYLGKWQQGKIIIKLDKDKIYISVDGTTTINTTYFVLNNSIYYINDDLKECGLKLLPSGDLLIEDTNITLKKIDK